MYRLCFGCVKVCPAKPRTRNLRSLLTRSSQPPCIVRFSAGIQRSSTTQLEPMDRHLSVDPEGEQVVDLTFVSEALGMPAAKGYGWAQFEFGDQIGQDNRYTIVRKLGWGRYSSTWLARDSINNDFVAIKALTGHMTDLVERGAACEPTVLELISRQPTSPHCTPLLDEFTAPGKGTAGQHLCLAMPVYGGSVKAMVRARKTRLPLPLVKRIALHLLRGLAHTHGHGVVHTDIKPDNILFSTTMTTDDIEAWVAKEPSRRHTPEASYDGMVQAAVSQPLPMISEEEAMQATYVLADFGCAEPTDLHDYHTISPVALRPPEVFLGAAWDMPVDIWTFGCLVYELVASQHLFRYQRNEKFGLDETENMLYQMMMHTRDLFRAKQLQASPKASEYFNADCRPRKNPTLINWPIKVRFDALKIEMSDEDATATVSLIGRCLQLDPADRPTAAELLSDHWFDGVD